MKNTKIVTLNARVFQGKLVPGGQVAPAGEMPAQQRVLSGAGVVFIRREDEALEKTEPEGVESGQVIHAFFRNISSASRPRPAMAASAACRLCPNSAAVKWMAIDYLLRRHTSRGSAGKGANYAGDRGKFVANP